MCLKVKFLQYERGLAYTCSLLVSGRHCRVIHRGGWPEGRGSARTLVAGGLPLSGEERFVITYLQNPQKLFYLPSLIL